jgi:hypothetical protein
MVMLLLDSIWLTMKVAAGEGTRARAILDIDRRMRREDGADDDVLIAHVAGIGRGVSRVAGGVSARARGS